jgi:RNA polymerase sigma-70 factor (ECF subfamily)
MLRWFERLRRAATGEAPADDLRDGWLRGDRGVMERVYRETFEATSRAAGRVLAEPADRDAIVQAVYVDLLESRSLRASWRGGELGAWIAAIARHRALDYARRESRLAPLPDDGVDAEPSRGDVDRLLAFRADLERFAATLEPRRRELLRLRFLEGLTQVEAAARLGVPRSTLEDWEKQIKASLRERLLGREDDGPTIAGRKEAGR